MNNTIGINQRIPLHILETALICYLKDAYSEDYIREQMASEYTGENRIKKGISFISKVICRSPLLHEFMDRKEEILNAMKYEKDKNVILIALLCASYPFAYDILNAMGRYFQVQEFVNSELIKKTICNKYGSNRSAQNGLYAVLPTFIEGGFFLRPKIGIYQSIEKIQLKSQITWDIYCKAYIINNPLALIGEEVFYEPYFGFCENK